MSKVSYLKAVTARSELLAGTVVATVVRIGNRVAFSEGMVVDETGAPVGAATSTFLVFDVPR